MAANLGFNPSTLLLVCLSLSAWGLNLEKQAHQRLLELANARASYQLALAGTKSRLSALVGNVASDTVLQQSVNWRLQHSVQGALQGRLKEGGVDQIALFDKACNDLGHASLSKALTLSCQTQQSVSNNSENYFWLSDTDTPILGLARRPAAGPASEGLVVATVHLDAAWLQASGDLSQILTTSDLAIGGKAGTIVFEESPTAAGAAPPLKATRMSDRLLLSAGGTRVATEGALVWGPLAGAFMGACWLFMQGRQTRRRTERLLGEHLHWCRSVALVRETDSEGPEARLELQSVLEKTRQTVDSLLADKSDLTASLSQKNEALQGQVRQLAKDLETQRLHLSQLAELDSLSVQLQRTSGAFLRKMLELREAAADLHSLMGQGLLGESKKLSAALMTWQTGIVERGARKFIRSLAETASTTGTDTALDEQLQNLIRMSQDISSLASSGSEFAQSIDQAAVFAARLAEIWEGLSIRSDDSNCLSLLDPLEDAKALVKLEFADVRFVEQVAEPPGFHLPKASRPAWTAAFYHLFLAMAEIAHDGDAVIASRLRLDGGRRLLVLQVTNVAGKSLPKRSENQARHMEIAKSILAPFGVTVAALPTLEGPFPVALSWADSEGSSVVAVRINTTERRAH